MAPQVSRLQNERGHLHGSPSQSATEREVTSMAPQVSRLQNEREGHCKTRQIFTLCLPLPPPLAKLVHTRGLSVVRDDSWRRKHKGVAHTTSHYYVPCQPVPLTINLPCTHLAIKKKKHTHTWKREIKCKQETSKIPTTLPACLPPPPVTKELPAILHSLN